MKWTAKIISTLAIGMFLQAEASSHQNLPAALTINRPFIPIDTTKAKEAFENQHIDQVVAAFKVDVEEISAMKRGELLLLENIEDTNYTLLVTEKHYFKNRTMLHFECRDRQLRCKASMIVGSTNTIMYIRTPSRSYEMESRNEIAYFYKGIR